jgi:hypothetical protein
MTDKALEKKVDQLIQAIESSNALADHEAHHEYIEQLISREKERAEMRREFLGKLAVTGAWGAIVVLASVVWYAIQEFFKDLTP